MFTDIFIFYLGLLMFLTSLFLFAVLVFMLFKSFYSVSSKSGEDDCEND